MSEPNSTWHEIIQATLKANAVKLVTYVPDRVFTPLIVRLWPALRGPSFAFIG